MRFTISPQAAKALRALEAAGYEAYLVGGCVRDDLMGIPPHDYDITTSARPDEIKRVFSGCRLVLDGVEKLSSNENVFSLFDLAPDRDYSVALSMGNEEACLAIHTQPETCAVSVRAFGAVGDDVMADAVVYMRYTVASFPFMALFYAVSSVFRAKGETRISMFAALFMNALNIVGNAVCIFGLHMGVVGVALPTLLARVVASLGMVALLKRWGGDVRIHGAICELRYEEAAPEKGIWARLFR